ncbi:MAG: hypothetical protein ACYCXN_10780 [Acidimicrobiales bacterium]
MSLLCRPGGQGLFCLSLAALGLQGFLAGLLVGLGGPLHPGHEARCQVAEAVMSLRPVKGALGHDALDEAVWGGALTDGLEGDGDEGAGGRGEGGGPPRWKCAQILAAAWSASPRGWAERWRSRRRGGPAPGGPRVGGTDPNPDPPAPGPGAPSMDR